MMDEGADKNARLQTLEFEIRRVWRALSGDPSTDPLTVDVDDSVTPERMPDAEYRVLAERFRDLRSERARLMGLPEE